MWGSRTDEEKTMKIPFLSTKMKKKETPLGFARLTPLLVVLTSLLGAPVRPAIMVFGAENANFKEKDKKKKKT